MCKDNYSIYCKHNLCLQYCYEWSAYTDPKIAQWQTRYFNQSGHLDKHKVIYKSGELDQCNKPVTFTLLSDNTASLAGNLYSYEFFSNGDIEVDGARYDFSQYCIHQEVNRTTSQLVTRVTLCLREGHCEGDYGQWFCLVDEQIIPALFLISLLFLGCLLIHIWREQRAKVFGALLMSAMLMLFLFYFILGKLTRPSS